MNHADFLAGYEERPQKVQARHLEKLALVYVRQSTMQQVDHHKESTRLQYALVGIARKLGWAPERTTVIDDDLGISGRSAAQRPGFQRILAEVALDHVGIIVGAETSRLARCNRDWHQLLEICARFGTLIADLDGLYDPSQYNDGLLLEIKGTMSAAEIHILRQRLLEGKLQKARRAELSKCVPVGYLRVSSREVTLDPDEEAQSVIRMVFDEFDRIGTIHGVLRVLKARNVSIGVRRHVRPDIGKLEWRRPCLQMVGSILTNPIYAGVYSFGRRRVDPRRQKPGRPATGRTSILPQNQWHACVRDVLPAYITWEQYTLNQDRLKESANTFKRTSAYKNGSALLCGLLVCGRCGYRMYVHYGTTTAGKSNARYVCTHRSSQYGESVCCGLSAPCLDRLVVELMLEALRPAATELSIRVEKDVEHQREVDAKVWRQRLERARYEAERARRQYDAVEPENRLVVRTLERVWEETLQAERALQEEFDRWNADRHGRLSDRERNRIRELATDLPSLWHAPTTTTADRREVLRILVNRVRVTVNRQSDCVDVVVEWSGGNKSQRRLRRPVGKLSFMEGHEKLLDTMRELRRSGYSASEIAESLNKRGKKTPTQKPFNENLVRSMLLTYGSVSKGSRRPPSNDSAEWWVADLANALEMPCVTLYDWLRRGWVASRRVRNRWVIVADDRECRRLRKMRSRGIRK